MSPNFHYFFPFNNLSFAFIYFNNLFISSKKNSFLIFYLNFFVSWEFNLCSLIEVVDSLLLIFFSPPFIRLARFYEEVTLMSLDEEVFHWMNWSRELFCFVLILLEFPLQHFAIVAGFIDLSWFILFTKFIRYW